jgi:orotidine-5'-phosphate decarboxylase
MTPSPIKTPYKFADKIFVALDVASEESAMEIVEVCGPFGVGFKVGLQLYTSTGPAFVRKLTAAGHRVFLDLKFHDIPNTVANASIEAARLGVVMFNVHALGGTEMLTRAAEGAATVAEKEGFSRPKVIAVTVLTSSNDESLPEVGIDRTSADQVMRLSYLASRSGLDGVVASALEAKKVRDGLGDDFLIVTPGIRPQNATKDDQKRVTLPTDALAAGANYLVIGRPVTSADDREKALINILESIGSASQ